MVLGEDQWIHRNWNCGGGKVIVRYEEQHCQCGGCVVGHGKRGNWC